MEATLRGCRIVGEVIKGNAAKYIPVPRKGSKIILPPGLHTGLPIDLPRMEPLYLNSNPTLLHGK